MTNGDNGDNLGRLEFAGLLGRKGNPDQSDRLEPLSTENERNFCQAALLSDTETDSSDSTVLSAFCTKNGAGRSGNISGDKLGGLTDHLGGLPCSEQVLALSDRGKPCNSGTWSWGRFAHFCNQKKRAVTKW